MKKTFTVFFALMVAAATTLAKPTVLDKETGHYKDMSYEALSDEGLSWEGKTRLLGGETAHYGELTAAQRKAKEKELKEFCKLLIEIRNRVIKTKENFPWELVIEIFLIYDDLPSVKQYSKEHKISPSTAHRKYHKLVSEGILKQPNQKWLKE